jgi:hypothetical protein
MNLRTALLAALAVSFAACAEDRYMGTEFVIRSAPPVAVEIGNSEIVIPVGIAVEVEVESYWDEGKETITITPVLVSADPSVFGVSQSASGGWLLYGVREGETELDVLSRGSARQRIPVRITAQP